MKINPIEIKPSNDGIWSTITKYHRYQYMPAEYQQRNEPVGAKPQFLSKLINAFYLRDSAELSNIWDKHFSLKKTYEKTNHKERLRMTEYRLKERVSRTRKMSTVNFQSSNFSFSK